MKNSAERANFATTKIGQFVYKILMSAYLFTYGTLRREFSNSFAQQLRQKALWCGKASLTGQLYDLGQYPTAVFEAAQTQLVHGEVWLLTDFGPTIALLDDYEGTNDPTPEYVRVLVPVHLKNGETLLCWAYQYNFSVSGLPLIAHGDYWRWKNE